MTVSFHIPGVTEPSQTPTPSFPLNCWYVAALSKELGDTPLARTLLNVPVVLFKDGEGKVAALEDRCCHRALPLSDGTLENDGIRCGYHGLLFNTSGKCLEIPGQQKIPRNAKVKSFNVIEQDSLVWIWMDQDSEPASAPPHYPIHNDSSYVYDGDIYHYDAPYQLIHDNLLDLSHLGYVHLKTIGGDASTHMNAEMNVDSTDEQVNVVRHMKDSTPPPTYTDAYPFKGLIDRWQEIEFHPAYLKIWTGGMDAGSGDLNDTNRGGFHMRGFHAITPETDTTCHYLWTMATNPTSNIEEILTKVIEQTALTFNEDKVVIESQYNNMLQFGDQSMIDIHVDVGANRARRIIDSLCSS